MKPAALPSPALAENEVGAGHILGRYELLMPIAAGGMAMVWAARLKGTRGFQKIVAVKTMLPNLSEDDQFEQMFLDEASLASKVRHPNAVEILDLGEQDGVLFLAMEWIDGIPLHQVMKAAKRHGGVPTTVATRIVMQACAGLHAAHELTDDKGKLMGLVHRDISPQNILVTFDGVAKVVDFGVAKAMAVGEGTTRAGQLKGKIGYMAPEQARGEAIDRRADVFAMGIVLYTLTTGKHPFRKESEAATLFSIASPEPVVPPRKLEPSFPAPLERVLLRALEKDRDKRFASANELFKALDKALPPLMRGSDEEVGVFVTSLFLEQRKQSQAALSEALERADLNQLSTLRDSKYSESTLNGRSGVTARIVPPSPTESPLDPEFSGVAKRPPKVMVVAGVCLTAALFAGWVWLGRSKPAAPIPALGSAVSAVTPTAPSASLPPPLPPPALTVSASVASSVVPPTSASVGTPPASKLGPRPRVTPASPSKKSWKHDPGF